MSDLSPLDWGATFESHISTQAGAHWLAQKGSAAGMGIAATGLDRQSHVELAENTSDLCEFWWWTLLKYAEMGYFSDFCIKSKSQCFLTIKITSCYWLCLAQTKIIFVINTQKIVCMVVNPKCSSKSLCVSFPQFALDQKLEFVTSFEYLGHVLMNNMSDSADIEREMKNMFTRCNMLISRFHC